ANSYCTRLLSSVAPSAPVRSEAPITATDFGRSSRSICWLVKRRSLISCSPSAAPLAAELPLVIPAKRVQIQNDRAEIAEDAEFVVLNRCGLCDLCAKMESDPR